MRTLHLYLTRETLATLLMTVLVFTFVLLLGNLFKEIATLIASGQVAPGFLLKAIGLLIPYVLVFSLPMGMLTATLLVFGRFSADHELTAARAGGISLLSLSAPVLAIGVLMSALSGWMNLQVAPQCRVAYKTMLFEYGLENTAALLTEKGFTDFPDHRVYVGSISGDTLRDVVIYQHDEAGNLKLRMHAEEASLGVDAKTEQVMLTLRSVDGFEFSDGKERTFVYSKYGPMALGKKTEASKQRPPEAEGAWLRPTARAHRRVETARQRPHASADSAPPKGGALVCVHRLHADRHPAGHPHAPPRDQHRHRHGAGFGDGLLRAHRAGSGARGASWPVAAPLDVGCRTSCSKASVACCSGK